MSFEKNPDGEDIEIREYIGNHLTAVAYINNPERDGAALHLEFKTIRGDIYSWAISTCFKDWLTARGGDGSIEIKQAIERIEHLLVTNEFSDRVYDLREGDTKTIRNLLAYRKVGVGGHTEEFWVPPTVFDKEFCNGVNKSELIKELQRIGWLLPPRHDGKAIHTRSLNGKRIYFYIFNPVHPQKHVLGFYS